MTRQMAMVGVRRVSVTQDYNDKRMALIEELADLVVAEGLDCLALRTAAERLGTSARMLLYYFETKEQLVLGVLDKISERLAVVLATNSSSQRVSAGEFLTNVLKLATAPNVAPFVRTWTDVIALGARGEAPYDEVAERMVASWRLWIESRLLPSKTKASKGRASTILAILEGTMILEMASPGSTRDVALFLSDAIS